MEKIIPWELIIACLKKEATSEQTTLFQHWLREESHAMLFREIETLWNGIQAEVSEARPDVAASWKKMEVRLRKNRRKKIPLRRIFHPILYKIMSAAAVVLLAIALFYGYQDYRGRYRLQTYAALYGKSKIILPDSSVVWLNAGTTLRYASAFAGDRQLYLEGEASFEVAKDTRHPFIVSTEGLKVKVYGTRFNVNAYREDENIKVALTRGSVSLLPENGGESFLKPGEIATFDKKSQALQIKKTDISMETFWAGESVSFKNQPLGYICKYLEKWYHIRIEVDPDIAESQYYTFTVKDDSIEAILRTMAKINPISYTFDEKNQVKIKKVEP